MIMKKYVFKVDKNYDKLRYFLYSIGLSSNTIKSLSKYKGQVLCDGKAIVMNERVFKNSEIILNVQEFESNNIVPIKSPIKIAYEDDYLIVIFKETNVATIPSYGNNEKSLANFITYYMQQKDKNFIFRAINRLDKDTSGFIIVCKDVIIYNLLSKFKIQKKYETITIGKLKRQTITSKIKTTKKPDLTNNILREIDNEYGKESITKIISTKFNKKLNLSYATIKIFTGRTHQIRLHLSSINHSILGDSLYGTKKADRMYLNCYYIKFYHQILKKYIVLKNQNLKEKFKELNLAYPADYQNVKM